MNQVRIVYHIALADFRERVRGYSFLVMLGAVVFLGYQAAIGNIALKLATYRGEFNSAWVGSMMAIIASFFLGWFGFYIVKGSITRDRETGVGQIMAATPLTRPLYAIGKWLSNLVVLLTMVIILAVVGIAIQIFARESSQVEVVTFLAPFVLIALPMLALTSALAVLFECVGFLRGGLGNIIYMFLFISTVPLAISLGEGNPALDPIGFHLLQQSMGVSAKAVFPDYNGGFSLGSTGEAITGVFTWAGVDWTPGIVLSRLLLVGVGLLIVLISAVLFDRFDSSIRIPGQVKSSPSLPTAETTAPPRLASAAHLTPISRSQGGFGFVRILVIEIKLLLKGLPWWWFTVAGGLIIAALFVPLQVVRAFILPVAWLWPVLIWSGMGNREARHNTRQMVFASAAPLVRQLPATWLAGFCIALMAGGGVALRLLIAGDTAGLLAFLSGALFIPSLSLALGVWSGSKKLFEVLYVSLWYLVMNGVTPVDYLGASSNGNLGFFLPLSIALILVAFFGRARQITN